MRHERLLFEAMSAIEQADEDRHRFDNVGVAEAAAELRRKLRTVLEQAWRDGFDAGYAASQMDVAAGRSAQEQAARAAAEEQT